MKAGVILYLLAIVGAPALSAQTADSEAQCKQYLQTPLPAEAANIAEPKTWPHCESYKSYSGISRKVDYVAARKCAWRERLAQQANLTPQEMEDSVFGGSAMLSVLYANGDGVGQNIPLAERLACEAGGAPAEIGIRLQDLESRRKPGIQKGKFNFCDDITSGFMEGFCAAESSELADQTRNSKLKALQELMTEVQRQRFTDLIRAEGAYAQAHGSGEIDTSGTARAMYEIDAEDSLRDDFVTALELYEQGKSLPRQTATEYRDADAKLNMSYRKIMADAEVHKNEYGAVQPNRIQKAERVWLHYRDLFVAFAELRYPSVSKDAWLTLLTRDRTAVLDGSFCDMDAVEGKCAWQGDTWKPTPLP